MANPDSNYQKEDISFYTTLSEYTRKSFVKVVRIAPDAADGQQRRAEDSARPQYFDSPVGLWINEQVARFGEQGAGDVSPLHGDDRQGRFGLCRDDRRVIVRRIQDGLEVMAVGHRSASEPFAK